MQAPKLHARGRRVIVIWKGAASHGSPIIGYVIDNNVGKQRTRPGSARRMVFKHLERGRYKFRIAATNAVGTSPFSSWVRIRVG
jgi:hypothetical protein